MTMHRNVTGVAAVEEAGGSRSLRNPLSPSEAQNS
jgi:hypothetical protein